MKVGVIGLGYIGLPTACILTQVGHDVLGIDINPRVIQTLREGHLHIKEDGLSQHLEDALASGRLTLTTIPEPCEVFIIAVPTPLLNGRADLSYIESAALSLLPVLRPGVLVVLESTSPPRTTEGVLAPIFAKSGLIVGQDILLAYAPERVIPGRIFTELVHNDRIVGGINQRSTDAAIALYSTFVKSEIYGTTATTAEFCKLMENTFRDVNIALANEFALLAEGLPINIWEAIGLANRHPRVHILSPGPGVGGHCIAVDPYFLVELDPEKARLIAAAREVNLSMPEHVIDLFKVATADIAVERVALLGLSYKADVDDLRESPSLEVARLLERFVPDVRLHDPNVPGFDGPIDVVLEGADCVLILTNHRPYYGINPDQLKVMRHPIVVDTRDVLPENWGNGFVRVVRLGNLGSNDGERAWKTDTRWAGSK